MAIVLTPFHKRPASRVFQEYTMTSELGLEPARELLTELMQDLDPTRGGGVEL